MPTLQFTFLILHIVCGYLALSAGTVTMISKKGQTLHRSTGKIFFFSMLGVTITSVYLSVTKDIPFLLFVGIFVFYQNFSGWRSVKHKKLAPAWFDWLILALALANAFFMIRTLNTVLLVFGGISLILVFTDIKLYRSIILQRKISPLSWMARHIGMMTGAFIGAFTAFLVVNVNSFKPAWLIWLAPTALLVPLMQYWTWKFTKKPLRRESLQTIPGNND